MARTRTQRGHGSILENVTIVLETYMRGRDDKVAARGLSSRFS